MPPAVTRGVGMGPKSGEGDPGKRNPERSKRKTASAIEPSPGQTCPAAEAEPGAPAARIGVIADTHGYLDPAIAEVFAGVTHIIHAGDIVDPTTLTVLRGIAPLTAVAGNIDTGELAESLPREVLGEAAGIRFAVGHKRKRLLKRLASAKLVSAAGDKPPCLVVFGHEHAPSVSWVEGVLYLNPGTATAPDEEDDAATVAIVTVVAAGLSVTFVPLPRAPLTPPADL